ncbi:MAG: endospore germination permease [Clostridiaceae bacterium]|nr:endospore germination permease [Clostridiaceae bacterium]
MDKISSKHLIVIALGLCVVSLKTYPIILLQTGHADTWICLIIASILILFFTYYIFKICKNRNCFSIVDIYYCSMGKHFGKFLILLLLITYYLTLVESSCIEANSLHTNLLFSTPTWFFVLFLTVPALYSVRKGKISVIIITTIGITLIIFAGINLGILTSSYKHYKNLFPVLVNGLSKDVIYTTIKSLGLYSFIFVAIPFARDVDNKSKLMRDLLIGMLLVVQMEVYSMIGIIATFGWTRAAVISYPKLIQTQEVSYFGFLESGEFYVMLQIVGGWYIKYILVFYSMLQVLKHWTKLTKYMPYIITLLVVIPSLYISKNIFLLFKILNYFSYICVTNFIIIPLIVFTIYNIKTKKLKFKESSEEKGAEVK